MIALQTKFTFAGFNFPRYIPEFSKSRFDRRTFRCVYYHAPQPLTVSHPGQSFYLDNAGSPSRWLWCDDVQGVRIDHTGWYTDEYGDSEKIRGIVVRLPHGRYLAGWSMGEGMASSVDGVIYDDEREAARAADSAAEYAAEQEREYQEEEDAKREEEDAKREEEERNQGGDAEETEGY